MTILSLYFLIFNSALYLVQNCVCVCVCGSVAVCTIIWIIGSEGTNKKMSPGSPAVNANFLLAM